MGPRARMTGLGLVAAAAGLLLNPSPSHAADVTFDVCADEGTVALPDPATYPALHNIPIWGFSLKPGGVCDAATLPGPTLIVNQGDIVHVNLTNALDSDAVSILFPGQALVPDTVGASAGNSTSYTFTASAPGTYLYNAGLNPDVQIPMGLYGALIVRPAGFPTVPGRAYGGANTAFQTEAVLVLSDLDPHLNASPHGFNVANYNPTYWLINGKAYPDTTAIPVAPSQTLLLRYVNAGSTNSAMAVVGLRQTVLAKDAFVQPFINSVASETIASGQTNDMLVTGPTAAGRYPLYSRQMHITNGVPGPIAPGQDAGIAAPHFPGGMMTFITVPTRLAFSTGGVDGIAIPGVLSPFDNADIYAWNGVSSYTRPIDGSGLGLPVNANVDGFVMIDYNTFYMSFTVNDGTSVPGIAALVQDEDIVKYDAGTWSMFFDGSAVGLATNLGEDVDAFDILSDGSVIVSTRGPTTVSGVVGTVAHDLLRCVPTTPAGATITGCTWSMYFDGSDVGLDAANTAENIDGVSIAGGKIYLSTAANFAVPGLSGEGKDVFVCNVPVTGTTTSCGSFTMYFDGSVRGLAATVGLDAIDLLE